jgi:hypothetical protein
MKGEVIFKGGNYYKSAKIVWGHLENFRTRKAKIFGRTSIHNVESILLIDGPQGL